MGITEYTFYAWRRRGDDDSAADVESEFSSFSHRCREAQAKAEQKALRIVLDAAKGGTRVVDVTTKRKFAVTKEVDPDLGPGNEEDTDLDRWIETGRVLLHEETTTVTKTLAPDARAAMWFLERRNRKEYGRQMAITGADGGPVQMQQQFKVGDLSDEDLDALEALLARGSGDSEPGGGAGGTGPPPGEEIAG